MNYIYPILLLASYLFIMFAIVYIKKDASTGNFTWGGGVMLMALYSFFDSGQFLPRHILATVLTLTWGLRLLSHVYMRYQKGADPRFVAWLQHKGSFAILFSFGWIFGANGFMSIIMSIPIWIINISNTPGLTVLDYLAIVTWLVGFYFESVSDYQLYNFTHNPNNKGKVLDTGLWSYCRHPNYFGEIVMWWSMFLIALNVPHGWMAIISASMITFNLLFVSGIPLLEKAMGNNAAYQEYKKRTSMIVPWIPKK